MSTAWERLSEEQKEALKIEYEELQMWDRKQRQIRERRLKEEGNGFMEAWIRIKMNLLISLLSETEDFENCKRSTTFDSH